MSMNPTSNSSANKAPAAPVAQITIDGVSYKLADLTEVARQQIGNVRLVDQELEHLQRQRAIASVARSSYVNAVSTAMPKDPTAPKDGERSAVINGATHEWASLGERVQGLLMGIRAADQELARINTQAQLTQTARGTFAQVVKQNLPS
jgi:hypothetical protein